MSMTLQLLRSARVRGRVSENPSFRYQLSSQGKILPDFAKPRCRKFTERAGQVRSRSQGVYFSLLRNTGISCATVAVTVGGTYALVHSLNKDQYFRYRKTPVLMTLLSAVVTIPFAVGNVYLVMCEKFAYVVEEAVESVWIEKTINSFRSKLVGSDINRIVKELLYAKEFVEITERRTVLQRVGIQSMFNRLITRDQIFHHLWQKTESFSNAETLYTSRLTHLLGSEARDAILVRVRDIRAKLLLGMASSFVVGAVLIMNHDRGYKRGSSTYLTQMLKSRKSMLAENIVHKVEESESD
mmetsp:Transcript_1416/g.1580  ORF Transcript_1416/g.1580 Transcript_1416/m.1580 type:complete len:298 (-) Transcript_1416:126-1019(-)